MTLAEKAASLVAGLPAEKAASVVEYAEYLAEKADEEAWARRFEAAANSPRFAATVRKVESDISQGRAEPMDFERL